MRTLRQSDYRIHESHLHTTLISLLANSICVERSNLQLFVLHLCMIIISLIFFVFFLDQIIDAVSLGIDIVDNSYPSYSRSRSSLILLQKSSFLQRALSGL